MGAIADPSTLTEIPDLHFAAGLPGFSHAHHFALVQTEGAGPFAMLKSLDDPDLAFVVVPPALFFPGYAPELDDAAADRLGLSDADDALLLVVVTLGREVKDATANLMAPIVVNTRTLEAAQVVLVPGGDDEYPLRAPLAG